MSEALASDEGGLDLDATTPIRGFDVRAAFAAGEDNFDCTVANPDHPLITAEREIYNREQGRKSAPPPPPMPVLAPMPSIYAIAPPAPMSRPAAPVPRMPSTRVVPAAPPAPPSSARHLPPSRYSAPSTPSSSFPESSGSLAPTALEVPQSYFSSYAPTPSGGVKAPPLSIVSSTSRANVASTMLVAMPVRRRMTGPKIAVMCGALALAAAVVAFIGASTSASGTDPNAPPFAHAAPTNPAAVNAHNASAPLQEDTVIPRAGHVQNAPTSTALPADVSNLLAPADPASDWRARLTQGQGAQPDTKAQH